MQAFLMILVLATAIGFGIGLPFTLGKTAALLSVSAPLISFNCIVLIPHETDSWTRLEHCISFICLSVQ